MPYNPFQVHFLYSYLIIIKANYKMNFDFFAQKNNSAECITHSDFVVFERPVILPTLFQRLVAQFLLSELPHALFLPLHSR